MEEPMEELTHNDLVTILVALQSEIETWKSFLAEDKKLSPNIEGWMSAILKYDVEQLERFQTIRNKVEKILHETPRNNS
jgi:hypothetical protein